MPCCHAITSSTSWSVEAQAFMFGKEHSVVDDPFYVILKCFKIFEFPVELTHIAAVPAPFSGNSPVRFFW